MPKVFNCLCCKYETERKSSFDNHLKSSKHLEKLNNPTTNITLESQSVSSLNSLACTSTEELTINSTRIMALEYQLKLKDNEIQNIINEYTLKLQMKDIEIKHKNDTIEMLKTNLHQSKTEEENSNIKMVVTEKIKNEDINIPTKKLYTKECLEKYMEKAPTIETYKSYLFKEDYNKYITEIDIDGKPANILNVQSFKVSDYKNNGVNNAISIIEELFIKFNSNELPFYCSDKKRNILHIKTNNGWIKETKENIDEFNKLLLDLAKNALWSVQNALGTTDTIYTKNKTGFLKIYGNSAKDWKDNNCAEINNVMALNGSNDTRHGDGDETRENKRLVVKKLKIAFGEMSKTFSDCCENE
jgi:hypothetical protein